MNQTILFYVRETYGTPRRYVCDQTQAQAIALLTGDKTLSDAHVTGLRALGFTLTETLRPVAQNLNARA